jgi:mannose-6-phosphate isomerase
VKDHLVYPYALEALEKPAIWGGESWKCWDENRVKNGPLAGATVAELRERLGPLLLGDLKSGRIFPILTKIIDARDWLSVQVHPDDAYANRVEQQPNGKTECWYVLSAHEGAEIVLGWTKDTSREEYARRVSDGTLGEILRRVRVRAGQIFYLPAGTLHAIGAGIVIFETQQSSDLTYRIFDWNRVAADGTPRQLHVEKAGDVLDYARGTREAVEPLEYVHEGLYRTALIADRRFVVERIVASDEPASLGTYGRPLIVMALDGELRATIDDETVALARYECALIPAAAEWCTVQAPEGTTATFTFVTPPRHLEDITIRLIAAGVEQDRIDHFLSQFPE